MMYQFVLWGYGKRGKRFMEICPHECLVAVIDWNLNVEMQNLEVPVISYEEYKERYSSYEVVISVLSSAEMVMQLERDGIYNYHLLNDCPPEIVGFTGRRWIHQLPIEVDEEHNYVIFGLNLYSILLREYLVKKLNKKIDIIPDDVGTERARTFIADNEYIVDRKPKRRETVLWATRHHYEKFDAETCEDVFNFLEKINEYRNEEIERFKDKHLGESCFIVATGPSLKISDLDVLKMHGCKCFGMNRIYLAFEQTGWRPDYYVAIDDRIIEQYGDDMIECDVENKFVGDINVNFWRKKKAVRTIYRFHDHAIETSPNMPFFAGNVINGIYNGGTVVYTCIQFAAYMGFKKIYLIGTDHNYSGSTNEKENHFCKNYANGLTKPNEYIKEKAELAFVAAKKYADEHDIKIYNATRGGKLEVFERVDFDSLFCV